MPFVDEAAGVLEEAVAPPLPKEKVPKGLEAGAAAGAADSSAFSVDAGGLADPKLSGVEVLDVEVAGGAPNEKPPNAGFDVEAAGVVSGAGAPKEKPPNAGFGVAAGSAEEEGAAAPNEKLDVDAGAGTGVGVLDEGGAPKVNGLLVAGAAPGAPNENVDPGVAAAVGAGFAPPRFGIPRILQATIVSDPLRRLRPLFVHSLSLR